MRMVDGLFYRQHWRRGYCVLLHVRDGAVAVGEGREPIFDQFDHLGPIGEASRVSTHFRVIDQIKPPHRLAEIFPVMEKSHNDNPSAIGLEDARRRDVVDMRSLARGLELPVAATVLMHADL